MDDGASKPTTLHDPPMQVSRLRRGRAAVVWVLLVLVPLAYQFGPPWWSRVNPLSYALVQEGMTEAQVDYLFATAPAWAWDTPTVPAPIADIDPTRAPFKVKEWSGWGRPYYVLFNRDGLVAGKQRTSVLFRGVNPRAPL